MKGGGNFWLYRISCIIKWTAYVSCKMLFMKVCESAVLYKFLLLKWMLNRCDKLIARREFMLFAISFYKMMHRNWRTRVSEGHIFWGKFQVYFVIFYFVCCQIVPWNELVLWVILGALPVLDIVLSLRITDKCLKCHITSSLVSYSLVSCGKWSTVLHNICISEVDCS